VTQRERDLRLHRRLELLGYTLAIAGVICLFL
jgi:hypothetical protein